MIIHVSFGVSLLISKLTKLTSACSLVGEGVVLQKLVIVLRCGDTMWHLPDSLRVYRIGPDRIELLEDNQHVPGESKGITHSSRTNPSWSFELVALFSRARVAYAVQKTVFRGMETDTNPLFCTFRQALFPVF